MHPKLNSEQIAQQFLDSLKPLLEDIHAFINNDKTYPDAYKETIIGDLNQLKKAFIERQNDILAVKSQDADKIKQLQHLYNQFFMHLMIVKELLGPHVYLSDFTPDFLKSNPLDTLKSIDSYKTEDHWYNSADDKTRTLIDNVILEAKKILASPEHAPLSDPITNLHKLAAVYEYNFDQALLKTQRKIPEAEKNRLKQQLAQRQWAVLHSYGTDANKIAELHSFYFSHSQITIETENLSKEKFPVLCKTQAEVDAIYAIMEQDTEYAKRKVELEALSLDEKAAATPAPPKHHSKYAFKFSLLLQKFGIKNGEAKEAKGELPPQIENLLILSDDTHRKHAQSLKTLLNSIAVTTPKTDKVIEKPGDVIHNLIETFDQRIKNRFKNYKNDMEPDKFKAIKNYREGMQMILALATHPDNPKPMKEWLDAIIVETACLHIKILESFGSGKFTRKFKKIFKESFDIILPEGQKNVRNSFTEIESIAEFLTRKVHGLNGHQRCMLQERLKTSQFQAPEEPHVNPLPIPNQIKY